MRLDKFLSQCGVCSRKDSKALFKRGAVSVNGVIAKSGEQKIDPETDEITVDKKHIVYREFVYYMLNKPVGYVSATTDDLNKTVISLIENTYNKEIFPVGRLDIDTEGLLLITNDGELAHRLLSPKKHVDKKYFAVCTGIANDESIKAFESGLDIGDDKPCLPADLKILSTDSKLNESRVEITLREGRFHQVKRMCEKCGLKVTYLKRVSMGTLMLDESLQTGEYRELTTEELTKLRG